MFGIKSWSKLLGVTLYHHLCRFKNLFNCISCVLSNTKSYCRCDFKTKAIVHLKIINLVEFLVTNSLYRPVVKNLETY